MIERKNNELMKLNALTINRVIVVGVVILF